MINFDSEKHFEDALCESLDSGVNPINGSASIHWERQPNFGPYGTGDVISISSIQEVNDSYIVTIDVIELKNTPIKLEHLAQIARYKTFMDQAESYIDVDGRDVHIEINYILVGLKTFPSSGDCVFLAQSIEWLSVYEVGIDLSEGVTFSHVSGWEKTKGINELNNCFEIIENYITESIEDIEYTKSNFMAAQKDVS